MTDPTHDPTPDLTPEQDAVRRLLAEARHDGPPPPEVVSRLDTTLASLQAERAASVGPADTPSFTASDTPSHTAPVIDLAARRRRRVVGIGVMAAAAVVVAGVALGQVLPQGGSNSGESAASSTASGADDGGAEFQAVDPESGGGAAESAAPEEPSGKAAAPRALPAVTLDGDLAGTLTAIRSESGRASSLTADSLSACRVDGVGQGRQVLVEVDGQPGLVVFGPIRGSSQEADVYLCDDPEPVRTLTLPAP